MIQFRLPPMQTDQGDLDTPEGIAQAIEDEDRAIDALMQEIARIANNPRYIKLPSGKALTEYETSEPALWKGCLLQCSGTLAETRREAATYGYSVCDGSGGTPDLRGKFLRGAAANAGAGGTGGRSSYQYTTTAYAGCHQHGFTSGAAVGDTIYDGCGGTCMDVPGHVHEGMTHSAGAYEAGSGYHRHSISWIGAFYPPYYDVVVVQKDAN